MATVPTSKETVLNQIPVVASSSVDLEKRRFFLQLATMIFGAGSFLTVSGKLATDAVQTVLERDRVHRELAFRILFGNDGAGEQFYLPATNNPYSEITGITLPTRDALRSIFQRIGFEDGDVKELRTPYISRIDGSLLLLGGPVPNMFARDILGHGEGSPLLTRHLDKRVTLPVHFGNILSERVGPGNRPKYRIFVNGNALSIADEGRDDFLLITSIPNVFSSHYGAFDHRIVNVAGFHGAGMRAIRLALQDRYLEQICKATESPAVKNSPGWQALVRVKVNESNRDLAASIVDWRLFPIDAISAAELDRVHEKVRGQCFQIASPGGTSPVA